MKINFPLDLTPKNSSGALCQMQYRMRFVPIAPNDVPMAGVLVHRFSANGAVVQQQCKHTVAEYMSLELNRLHPDDAWFAACPACANARRLLAEDQQITANMLYGFGAKGHELYFAATVLVRKSYKRGANDLHDYTSIDSATLNTLWISWRCIAPVLDPRQFRDGWLDVGSDGYDFAFRVYHRQGEQQWRCSLTPLAEERLPVVTEDNRNRARLQGYLGKERAGCAHDLVRQLANTDTQATDLSRQLVDALLAERKKYERVPATIATLRDALNPFSKKQAAAPSRPKANQGHIQHLNGLLPVWRTSFKNTKSALGQNALLEEINRELKSYGIRFHSLAGARFLHDEKITAEHILASEVLNG